MSKKEIDNLYLTKNERLGISILFVLLLVLIIIPWLYNKSDPIILKAINNESVSHSKSTEDSIDSLLAYPKKSDKSTLHQNSSKSKDVFELFAFDPNQIQAKDALRLGISEKSYHILQKYLATGAKIKTVQQFSKIYGIDAATFNRLEPFIKLKTEYKPFAVQNKFKAKPLSIINLNTAESEDLIPLPGIGEKLATRIIKYRNLLGGYTNESQLHEIYGLQDSTIQKFRHLILINEAVNKINLNTSEYEDLKKHPYIGPQKARIICEYRKQHHAFEGLNDLYKIVAIDSSWIKRISEYLSFE